ncbi:MAG: GNAT family N-acetyltransferase [Saprospiraceae bacterium]
MAANDFKVTHMREEQKFHTYINDEEAYLLYRPVGATMLEYYEVYVPLLERGQEIGTKLVEEALRYAQQYDYRVVDTCPFVSDYIDDNPRYANLRVDAKQERDRYYQDLPD